MGKKNKDKQATIVDFVAAIAHDMNNAICSSHNEAQLLSLSEDLTEAQRKGVQAILCGLERAAYGIYDICHTIRTLSQDEIVMISQDFNVYDCIDGALLSLQPNLEDDGTVSVTRDCLGRISRPLYHRGKIYLRNSGCEPVVAKGDGKFTRFVFSNLLTNACIHGKSRVNFDVETQGDYVKCMVANDSDNGIPEQYRERIFQPYFRIPGTKVSGSGLGLYACKRLVESQGGRVWFENPDGEVRFYFRLPSARSPASL